MPVWVETETKLAWMPELAGHSSEGSSISAGGCEASADGSSTSSSSSTGPLPSS
ncbi:MAG: hypothetical protein U0168_13210 [Nannocystaceae bacterium]